LRYNQTQKRRNSSQASISHEVFLEKGEKLKKLLGTFKKGIIRVLENVVSVIKNLPTNCYFPAKPGLRR